MMRALVVYESMFGNTQAIANAIADGLSDRMRVEVLEVGAAPATIADVALLVVGGPTHAFGMSRPQTRQDAARQAPAGLVSPGSGLREWLATLQAPAGIAAATFDTRIRKPRLPGSAARAAEKRLRRLGFRMVAPAASFHVEGTLGPLQEGEQQRARRWGESVGSKSGDPGRAKLKRG
jgi:Flavodoxin